MVEHIALTHGTVSSVWDETIYWYIERCRNWYEIKKFWQMPHVVRKGKSLIQLTGYGDIYGMNRI